jgi:hypothetical protein
VQIATARNSLEIGKKVRLDKNKSEKKLFSVLRAIGLSRGL